MMKINKVILKKIAWSSFIITIFSCSLLFAKVNNKLFRQCYKKPLNDPYSFQDKHKEDIIIQEIYSVSASLYAKLIEVAALYYCQNIIVDADVRYEKIVVDISQDLFRIIVLFGKYIPALYKNKKISLIVKIKKLTVATSILMTTMMILKKLRNKKILSKTNNQNVR